MHFSKKGFTLKELIVVIGCISVIITIASPVIIRSSSQIMIKTHAAADAASLHSTVTNITMELLEDKRMKEIVDKMSPTACQTDPYANLWINYSRPVTLDAYYVDGENYYSIEYLSEVAQHGSSDLDLKEPFTLGFWYKVGSRDQS